MLIELTTNVKLRDQVWRKAQTIQNENPEVYRQDKFGSWIAKHEFEEDQSLLGWKICKIKQNLPPTLDNLEPVFWKNVQPQLWD